MGRKMTRWERVRAALRGEEVDRVPVSMWRHFFAQETSAGSLAEAMLGFQARYDWDFMKVNPRASYHVEDWGVKVRYDGDRSPAVVECPVKTPDDWLKIGKLDINKGVLGQHLEAVEIIARGLRGEVPFIMTVFTPLSVAGRLLGSEQVMFEHIRGHWDKVSAALDAITETFAAFSNACLDRGASGLFFATTAWATSDRLTEEEYRRYARPHDLKLLIGLAPAEFHLLHVCRPRNLLSAVKDYPVHAFNWDARAEGNPSLAAGRSLVGGRTVVGGVPHDRALVESAPSQLASEVAGMRVALGGRGWMLGPGCTFLPGAPDHNLRAIRDAVA